MFRINELPLALASGMDWQKEKGFSQNQKNKFFKIALAKAIRIILF